MICSCCDKHMTSGYMIHEEWFCSDDCLRGWYSVEEYDELCQESNVKIIHEGGV